jgi:hypothetical protein
MLFTASHNFLNGEEMAAKPENNDSVINATLTNSNPHPNRIPFQASHLIIPPRAGEEGFVATNTGLGNGTLPLAPRPRARIELEDLLSISEEHMRSSPQEEPNPNQFTL